MEILVFGAGALGSLVGGLLAREHAVTLVGRDPHVAVVRESGLRIEGGFDTTVHPSARTDAGGHSADLAVVTVKAGDVPAAAAALDDGDYDLVWSLTNGLTEERLRETLGDRVLAGTATYGAELPAPGVVRCTGVGELHVGELEDGETESDRARGVADACRVAGVSCVATARMGTRRWRKLAVNAGINGVTALARLRNEAVLSDPARTVAARAARETARVARAEGVELDDETAVDAVREVAAATADNRSSTLQDVHAGRRTEADAINGAVVRRGEAAGVDTPTNRTLWELLVAWATANADTSE